MYNIRSGLTGMTMLLQNTDRENAEYWLRYYKAKFPAGKPYPSGKGFYPDYNFFIVFVGDDDVQ